MTPATPAVLASSQERLEPVPVDRVHVRHDGDGDVQRGLGDRREDRRRACAPASSARRDASWITPPSITGSENGIPTSTASAPASCERLGAAPRRPRGTRPSRTGRTPVRRRRGAHGAPSRDQASATPRAERTVSRSLSPRPERHTSTLEPFGSGLVSSHPITCDGSSAGQDALGPRERLESLERLRVGGARRTRRARRPAGTRARDRRPDSRGRPRSSACRRPARRRPGAGS